jgi:hypothetical protein
MSMEESTLGSDVTTYATVVAYRRLSLGRRDLSRLCNSRNISTNDSLSLIHAGGWRLKNYGLDKYSLGSRRDIISNGYLPESCHVSWAFMN